MKIEYSDLTSAEKSVYIKSNLINYSFAFLFFGVWLSFVMPIFADTVNVSNLDQSVGYNIFTVMLIMVFCSSFFAFLMGFIIGFFISDHFQLWTRIDVERRKKKLEKMTSALQSTADGSKK